MIDRDELFAAFAALQGGVDAVCALGFQSLTNPERVVLLQRLERVARRLLGPRNALLQQLTEQASPQQFGAKSLPEALSHALSISRSEARRRTYEAADLAPRTALTGATLPPVNAYHHPDRLLLGEDREQTPCQAQDPEQDQDDRGQGHRDPVDTTGHGDVA